MYEISTHKKSLAYQTRLEFFDKSYNFYQNLQVFTLKAKAMPSFG